jgi:cell division protein FtsB
MRKVILYGIIFFQIALIVSLVRGIQLSRRSTARITGLEEAKAKLLSEREKLKKEEEYVQSEYYLEKVAREELHLAKPGETIVIIPNPRETTGGATPEATKDNDQTEMAIWKRWILILGGKIQ